MINFYNVLITNALYDILQYENQCNIPVVGWTKKGPLGRPKWSDSQGKVGYLQPLNRCMVILSVMLK